MGKIVIVLAVVAVAVGVLIALRCNQAPAVPPKLDPQEWWGPNELKGKVDNSIKPFQVKFEESAINDLKARLKNHRPFTAPLEGIGFEYGFNTKTLNSWVQYWAEKYPFSEREKFLNKFPQYKTNIQGLDIHFIRVKPQVPSGVQVVPILLMHGWPGSVREFYEVIPLLTKQNPGYDFAFEVIVPSLPGYGFSDAPVRPGLAAPQTAVIFKNLMNRLGFKKYYIQGGDWGAIIAASIATLFPEDVLGHHTNMPSASGPCAFLKLLIGAVFPSLVVDPNLADRMYPLTNTISYILEESGYFHIQATKPDTVGVGLNDSPAGLLAYILEKFSTWTKKEHRSTVDGKLDIRFTKDQLIDNLMIYWTSQSITTSVRFYAENYSRRNRDLNIDGYKIVVPTWALQAKNELVYQSPSILRVRYTNLINTVSLDDGGHFIAFERPKVFAEDVFTAVKAFREWHTNNKKTEL
ncbi:juvenile hormone epoxide hydrolase-like [Achroia grisella]|uniref:juvenile hormone epoxide hydrolase-like n=1 Tax=Achroia grisella TaxID=688607 RepID=UPI0027D31D2B|nr:juvenile hormone epoxide hydrolase-like [Achroia grisella]